MTTDQPQTTTKYAYTAAALNKTTAVINPCFARAAVDPATGHMLELLALLKGSKGNEWNIANVNEIDRLAYLLVVCGWYVVVCLVDVRTVGVTIRDGGTR